MIILPIYSSTSPRWSYQISLDGTKYTLAISWNTRESAWYLDVQDASANSIVSSIKLVPDILLLQQFKGLGGLPLGDLFLYDVEQNPATAVNMQFADLGTRYLLVYYSLADFQALESA
jgi:hypothetical protein